MKRARIFFLPAAGLLALMFASCSTAPATTTTPPTTTSQPPPSTTTKPPTSTTSSQTPKYGGTITVVNQGDILGFDEAFNAVWITITNHLTNDELLTGDWAKGPAGTNQYSWLSNGNYAWNSKGPSIADSWKIVEPGHMTFTLHQGIHFGLNSNSEASRLVAGRELTTDDVAYSVNRMLTEPTSYWKTAAPQWTSSVKVTVTDKYNIDVTGSAVPNDAYNMAAYLVDFLSIIPKEVVAKYGDMRDWHNSVGSGPYFLTDFVSNSSASFIKNPKYWRTNPVGPGKGNQLPYADNVKMLIITDTSTLLSAVRTAKVDVIQGLTYDDANGLRSPNLPLQELSYIPQGLSHVNMRIDKQDLPYKDIRVRDALMMATDFNQIITGLMGNDAIAESWPITPMPDFKDAYLPLDQAPADVQNLYKYNPDQAKKLLSDAGYPNGFKANIIYSNVGTFNADYLSVLKQMWIKVNVDLTLQPVDFGVYNTIWAQRNYPDLLYGLMASSGTYRRATNYLGTGAGWNLSYVNDPKALAARDQMVSLFNSGDDAGADKVNKDFMPYVLGQAWVIPTPAQRVHTFWWPWLKNYSGETCVGMESGNAWAQWIWCNQDLKKSMGH